MSVIIKKSNDENNLDNLKKEMSVDFHTADINELVQRFHTNLISGLTTAQVHENRRLFGVNVLTPPKRTPELLKFLKALFSGFSLLLTFGGIFCFIAYILAYSKDPNVPKDNLYLGIVLEVVVLVTGVFSYYQESKSSRIMESFKKLVPQECIVLRDSKKVNIKPDQIVVGDIVFVRGGDLNPADMRVLEAKSLKVDNSSITGESEPQKRFPSSYPSDLPSFVPSSSFPPSVPSSSFPSSVPHASAPPNFLEAENMAFAFTYCVDGTGTCLVCSVGDNTLMGRIAKLTSQLETGKTPIGIEIEKFIKLITVIAFLIGGVFFVLSLVVTKNFFVDALVFLIGIIVANVPEGLLMTVTVTLTLCAKKMAKKNCLIKNLESVETLGSTSVICSDKTGTLTQNRMTVSHLWADCILDELGTGEAQTPEPLSRVTPTVKLLVKNAALCNRAEFREDQDFDRPVLQWKTNGDASESALIKFVELKEGPLKVHRKTPTLFEIPFNSVNKFQISLHPGDDNSHLCLMKGAPERIADRCKFIMVNGEVLEFASEYQDKFQKAYEEMGGMGERVLGFCMQNIPKSNFPLDSEKSDEARLLTIMNDCVFIGLASLIDPPRAAVPHAVELCRQAGIKVIMVTGDHPITARAIAKNVGIITEKSENFTQFKSRIASCQNLSDPAVYQYSAVITGTDLKDMSSHDLDEVIKYHREIVFARTSPQQKLIIVEGFQRTGAVVAVTGDGVNDSPALKKADIGVAMGIAGSDVAKQAADMILLDDNFATIVTGVQEGRIIFDNLKKSIAYTLTSNIPEITPFLLNIMVGIPLPLSTITILCIDLGTDLVPAISLAYEKAETDIMKRKPRNPKTDSLVNMILINYSYLLIGVYQAVAALLVYLFIMMDHGFTWQYLVGNKDWNNVDVLFVKDSFQQEWSYTARKDLEYTCQTAYFFTIVIVQIADLLISKTRMMSIFQQGIFSNWVLILGIASEVFIALLFTFAPFFNTVLQTRPFHPKYLIPAFFLCFLMWAVDEIRRYHMRKNPGGFIQRETYY